MRRLFEISQTRRDFLRSCARAVTLGILGAGSASIGRRNDSGRAIHTCVNRGVCRGCTAFEGCILPQARSAKQAAAAAGKEVGHDDER